MVSNRDIVFFVPIASLDPKGQLYLKGCIQESQKSLVVYFYKYFRDPNFNLNMSYREEKQDEILGYIGDKVGNLKTDNYILINLIKPAHQLYIMSKDIVINEHKVLEKYSIIYYDSDTIVNSEELVSTRLAKDSNDCLKNDFITTLCYLVSRNNTPQKDIEYDDNATQTGYYRTVCENVWKHSALCAHTEKYLKSLSWIYFEAKTNRKVSIKMGNYIAAFMTDILLGLLVIYWLNQWDAQPHSVAMESVKAIVDNLRSLLQWLMGSPAGLKLNQAFTNMLGKFFLYHTNLWWMFLEISISVLDIALRAYLYIGCLGITFQAAILSDLLSVASFHIYCIYVYAARLYNIQICGLTALFRLFLGRKHNPLRGGIDSCEYTNQQLFVGTLAFTILLFLLPTTAVYYVVFTLFRLVLLICQGFLTRLSWLINSLPLYILFLWIVNSPKIMSTAYLEISHITDNVTIFHLRFTSKRLYQILGESQAPATNTPPAQQWSQILSNLWRGNLLYPI